MNFAVQVNLLYFTKYKYNVMFDEITEILEGDGRYQIPDDEDIFLILMGRPAAGIPNEVMVKIWTCSCRHIANMYRWKLKRGIG